MVGDTVKKKKIGDLDISFEIDVINSFCIKHHIKSLKLFGSILTDKFNESSDIDILVKFEEDFIPGFFKLIDLQEELSTLFHNRSIDLRTKRDLSKYFREEVLNSAVEIYG